MTSKEVDALRRELKIASASARKLAVALDISWAVLTHLRGFSSKSVTKGDAPGVTEEENGGGGQPPLPF